MKEEKWNYHILHFILTISDDVEIKGTHKNNKNGEKW